MGWPISEPRIFEDSLNKQLEAFLKESQVGFIQPAKCQILHQSTPK
jgi:hypothetical protein